MTGVTAWGGGKRYCGRAIHVREGGSDNVLIERTVGADKRPCHAFNGHDGQ